MDKYDPKKRIGLLVDEWGTWWDEEPGTVSGHLYQQNTLRDAMVAALSLNTFHRFTDRVKMTNIAQIANVLQAMVLTKDDKMVLTPTYYLFKMYVPHQDAKLLPLNVATPMIRARDGRQVPVVDATASLKNGITTISLVNTDLNEQADITIDLSGVSAKKISGEILTADKINAYNDFTHPDDITLRPFTKGWKQSGGKLTVTLPAKSIVTLSLK